MRQVDDAELVWRMKYQLGRLSTSLRNGLAARNPEVRKEAEQRAALHLAREGLRGLEVLSDTPMPPGSDLFSHAAYGKGGVHISDVGDRDI